MELVKIEKEIIILFLSNQRSKIRIVDSKGNLISSPTKCLNIQGKYFVEWMITIENAKNVFDNFLRDDLDSSKKIVETLKENKDFVESSPYSKREKITFTHEEISSFKEFKVYKNKKKFYFFERELPSKIKMRIIFKNDDFGVDPVICMYVLIPFNKNLIKIKNSFGPVLEGEPLGKKCYCEWKPSKNDLIEMIITIAEASEKQRDALVKELNLDFKT